MSNQYNVCVPMKVDAFRLNAAACDGPSRLPPISRHEYMHLRLDDTLRCDIQEDLDLSNTAQGAKFSERVTNLATGQLKRHRLGIYLHWILPRFYRTGLLVSHSADLDADNLRNQRGYKPVRDGDAPSDPQSPTYRPLPTRWIVLRHLLTKTPPDANIPEFQAFVIESDRLRKMEDLGPDVDIEVDVTPFVYMEGERNTLDFQAETFIGFKQRLEDWTESDRRILRVPLSVLGSVNPLFPDFQPHNPNVFSILDNFAYEGSNGTTYLQKATANYYVLGWHPKSEDDPFHLFEQDEPYPTYADRLDGCYMKLADDSAEGIIEWTNSPLSYSDPTRAMAHGAMYQVEWDLDEKPPNVPADDIAQSYNDYSPVSVGVNPVDALLAVTHTHALTLDKKREEGDTTSKPDPLAQDILSLQSLTIKQEEDPDSQLQGTDTLYTDYFVPSDGGQQWHISGALAIPDGTERPSAPSEKEVLDLAQMNEYQMAVNLCTRQMDFVEWEIWAEWWKWVSCQRERTDEEKDAVKDKVNKMADSYEALKEKIQAWKDRMSQLMEGYNWEALAGPRYYNSRDPTLLLCGMQSGWPVDFGDDLKVRLDSQLVTVDDIYDGEPAGWSDFQTYISTISPKLPSRLRNTATDLLKEFYAIRPVPSKTPRLRSPPAENILYPLYHDLGPDSSSEDQTLWRDQWNGTQAWFPLFAEWEIEYFHIGLESWVLAPRQLYGPPKLYAQVKDGVDISKITNKRTLSGRSLIMPQTTSMMRNTVEQLLRNKSATPDDMSELHDEINKLPLLTFSMSGVGNQLTTKQRGTHVNPNMYQPGYGPLPIPEALDATARVIDENAIRLMLNTTQTPFGDFPDFGDTTHAPFKPSTHGQFRFTKLNIVDKFGQAISAIDPTRGTPPRLHPYISEFYGCPMDSSSGSGVPHTVIDDPAQCIQVGPYPNQDSRLNGHYVIWDESGQKWLPVTEYDNPIWGWLVVNYVDNGLQVFLPDGTFYREIRLGGPEGTSSGIRAWLPFDPPPPGGDDRVPPQLDALLLKLRDPDHDYLKEFFDVMTGALDASASSTQYAGYLPAITGKPFALVNTGWSLELSHPPHVNQSTSVPDSAIPELGLDSYSFQVKFGDKDRTFDGLLGYFRETSGRGFDLDKFYTYFGYDAEESMTTTIEPGNYPVLTPFYNPPGKFNRDEYIVKTPAQIHAEYDKQMTVFGMLIDPFTVIHAYTSCHPVQVLRLPQWALTQALNNITAFFHVGPVVMPYDAPPYDPSRVLSSGADLSKIPDPPEGTQGFLVPSVAVADWAWLQPYVPDVIGPVDVDSIVFNPFPLAAIKNEPALGDTPYTAVEGYLYLKRPIVKPEGGPQ